MNRIRVDSALSGAHYFYPDGSPGQAMDSPSFESQGDSAIKYFWFCMLVIGLFFEEQYGDGTE